MTREVAAADARGDGGALPKGIAAAERSNGVLTTGLRRLDAVRHTLPCHVTCHVMSCHVTTGLRLDPAKSNGT